MPISRTIHPNLQRLPKGVIVPQFDPLTEEQIRNPLYTDFLDYDENEWEALTPQERIEIEENSPSCWIHKYVKIKDKDENIIDFVWNEEQWIMFLVVREFWRRGLPVRLIILKGRQFGSTTFWLSLLYYIINKRVNAGALLLAHEKEASQAIFTNTIDVYQDNNPIAFDSRRRGKGYIYLSGINSRIACGSGQKKHEGTGSTFNYIFCEEVSKWKVPDSLVRHMFQTVPLRPNTMIVQNSTADGFGNYFHNTWRESKSVDAGFKGIFLPWYIHAEYSMPFGSREEKINFVQTLTEKEIRLKEEFGITLEQLRWRRFKIGELKGSNDPEAAFMESYPSTDTEPFISTSTNFFDNIKLNDITTRLFKRNSENKVIRGMVGLEGTKARFIHNETGWLEIFAAPEKGRKYIVSVDTSMGGEGGDRSSIDVLDIQSFTQVAHSNALIDGTAQAERAIAVARLYNGAIIAPERNYNPMVTDICNRDYGNVYKRKLKGGNNSDRLGWRTDEYTRLQMLERLRWALNFDIVTINCIATAEEMMSFGYDGKKIQGQHKMPDDRVMSLAIAVEIAYSMFFRPNENKVQKIKVGGKLV